MNAAMLVPEVGPISACVVAGPCPLEHPPSSWIYNIMSVML